MDAREEAAEILAVEVLHGDVGHAVDLAAVGDLGDVLVTKRGGEARLGEEHVDHAAVGGMLAAQALDRDRPPETLGTGDAREHQLGDVRAPEMLDDLVATQAATNEAFRVHHSRACARRPRRVKKAFSRVDTALWGAPT